MERSRNYAQGEDSLIGAVLVTEPRAAELLNISYHSLVRLRTKVKTKPKLPYSCFGGVIRYNPYDLIEWAKTQRFANPRGRKKKSE